MNRKIGGKSKILPSASKEFFFFIEEKIAISSWITIKLFSKGNDIKKNSS